MAVPISLPKLNFIRFSLFTWLVVLLVSDLPNAVWQLVAGEPPAWIFWAKIGFLLFLIFASLQWKAVQTIRIYLFLLMLLMLAQRGMNWLMATPAYNEWQNSVGWVAAMAGYQSLKLAVVIIMIAALLMLGRKRKDFFLTPGQLGAPAVETKTLKQPARRSLSWGLLGLILGICIAPLTLLFFGIGNFPASSVLIKALPYFPAALLFAACNAFAEEMQFRASLLGELQKAVGPDQSIWLTSAFFGLAHYFGGAPAGIPGVLIAGALGALFAKVMLGSKGMAVPWFIHFCQNAVIYAFWAIGSVA